jgi:hypothetical protein
MYKVFSQYYLCGILAHESALQGGKVIELPAFTFSERKPEAALS